MTEEPSIPPPAEPSPHRRAERIYLELRALLRDALKRRLDPDKLMRELKVRLTLEINPLEAASPDQAPPEKIFAEALLARIGQVIDQEVDSVAPFPPGRLRCYWCSSYDCVHSAPEGPHTVFGGYSPTGVPLWRDLAAVALEQRHPSIECLYGESPVPLTIVQTGSDLLRAQLPVYGRHSGHYRILAQVAVGYFNVAAGSRGERATVAMTVQAVEVDRGRPTIHLNTLGRLPDGTDFGRLIEEDPGSSRLGDALAVARQRLSEIDPREKRPRQPRQRQALGILERFARNLDRIFRQDTRRTKHARQRHLDRERPAAAALRDAMAAKSDEIYRDVRESTWVVIGPRSRVHIFNDAGKHITSVVYPGETVRRRTSTGLWRAAPPDSVQGFRDAVGRLAGEAGGRR